MKKFLSLFFAFAWTMIAFAATETTVYFSAPQKWISGYTVKLNVQLDEGENVWGQYEMTLTTSTYNGDPVYVATYTDTNDGVGVMQFQLWEGTEWRNQDQVISSRTAVSDYNGKMYVHDQGWTTAPIEEGGEGPENPEEPTFTTVYFVNTPNWVNVHAYAWIDERQHIVDWPGAEMEPTKQVVNDYVVYFYELDTRYGNIIFNNGQEGEALQQTEDFVFSAKTPYYYYADNTWYATADDITAGQGGEGGEGGETPEEDVYTVVGFADIFGTSWDIKDNTNNMVKGDDGLYTLVKENVHLAIQEYQYKVVTNHSWEGWQIPGYGAGNQSFAIETAGIYTVTFTLDVEKATLIANPVLITADENQEVPETVYTVAGSEGLMGSDWNLNDENNTMVKGEEAGIYTLTKENVHLDALKYSYKAVANHTWDGYQVPDKGDNELVINVAGTYNVTFTLNTREHTLIAEPELVKADEPVETFTGFIQPGIWDADGAKYAAWVWKAGNEGQWTAFADAVDGAEENIYAIDVPAHIDSLIFVRFKPETETPSWETEIVGESEQYVWIWNRTGSYGTPKAENCRTFVITDWDKGLWCGQEEEEEEETSEFHVYLQGSWNNWEGLHEF
ncbi:MAG: starch-binding protein, partial [Paludibacteraceae bacterium]|nr:starch-binding protein [Paludibacteraceae bacterium]